MPKYDSPPYASNRPVGLQYGRDNDGALISTSTKGWDSRPTSPPVSAMYNPFYTGRPRTPGGSEGRTSPIDRQGIIRKIKNEERMRSQSPVDNSQRTEKSRSPTPLSFPSNPLRHTETPQEEMDQNTKGLDISRPRSALHRGDFREEAPPSPWRLDGQDNRHARLQEWDTPVSTSPVVPWHQDFPAAAFCRTLPVTETASPPLSSAIPLARPRAVSHASLAGSFAYQPPTSPLVHQANAADIPDFEPHTARRRIQSPDRNGRRHTYSPRLLHQSKSALDCSDNSRPVVQSHAASLRRESAFPSQAHQPRRSIGSFASLTQAPHFGARRPSISDVPPLQHAPMVGSYEESILRGRMSTTPSKPLNFVAQIGVLGKGDCKPSLRCPPHVIIPFPAVFYSYSSGLAVDPEPSPYVGMVDLENSIPKTPSREGSRKRRRHRSPHEDRSDSRTRAEKEDNSDLHARKRKHNKLRRRSQSPKEPPGGSYRIPQKGQLQIVLKNPNKTAVKLFLVPYDLSDMEPGQKTFIRQRSYSAGPIIDMPISSRNNYGTDRPEAAISATSDPADHPILRYLIHLHICCPSKNRYYLYQNIRVVFANRVPDGKEKLRSEIQMPEPRYSAYKPGHGPNAGLSPANMALRRRSVAFPAPSFSIHSENQSALSASVGSEHIAEPYSNELFVKSFDKTAYRFPNAQQTPALDPRASRLGAESDYLVDSTSPQSPTSPLAARPIGSRIRNLSGDGSSESTELTFSRETSRERQNTGVRTESLLSKRLKDLEMRSGGDGDGKGIQ